MNKHPIAHEWIYYIETPRRDLHPVKIDAILHRRLQTFLDMKNIKLLLTEE